MPYETLIILHQKFVFRRYPPGPRCLVTWGGDTSSPFFTPIDASGSSDYFIPHQEITLRTSLQAVAVRATCFKTVTVCSIYLPPSLKWRKADIEDLFTQLPPPVLLLGDFNAHNTSWGCNNTDSKGKVIEDFLLQSNLSILNNGSSTYLHPGTGSTSAIDISICQPSLFLDLSWSAHEDLCGCLLYTSPSPRD